MCNSGSICYDGKCIIRGTPNNLIVNNDNNGNGVVGNGVVGGDNFVGVI